MSRWLLYGVRRLLSELLSGGELLSLDADGTKTTGAGAGQGKYATRDDYFERFMQRAVYGRAVMSTMMRRVRLWVTREFGAWGFLASGSCYGFEGMLFFCCGYAVGRW